MTLTERWTNTKTELKGFIRELLPLIKSEILPLLPIVIALVCIYFYPTSAIQILVGTCVLFLGIKFVPSLLWIIREVTWQLGREAWGSTENTWYTYVTGILWIAIIIGVLYVGVPLLITKLSLLF